MYILLYVDILYYVIVILYVCVYGHFIILYLLCNAQF